MPYRRRLVGRRRQRDHPAVGVNRDTSPIQLGERSGRVRKIGTHEKDPAARSRVRHDRPGSASAPPEFLVNLVAEIRRHPQFPYAPSRDRDAAGVRVHACCESTDTAVERAPGGGSVPKGAFLHGFPLPSSESEVRHIAECSPLGIEKVLFSDLAHAQHTSRAPPTST